jgi:HPt (histidine-containing phosphotransfer) domain-containing protein
MLDFGPAQCSPEFVAMTEVAGQACRLTNSGVCRIARADFLPLVKGSDEHLHNLSQSAATSSVLQLNQYQQQLERN